MTTEMKPLLEESISPEAAMLLRSAETDGPASPQAAEARTLAAIGALPSAVEPSAPAGGRLLGSLTRAGTIGTLAAVVVFSAVVAVRATSTEAPPPSSAPEAPAPATPAPAPATPAADDGVRVDDLPTAPAVVKDERAPTGSARATSPGAKAPRYALEDELAPIDAARAALGSGHPDAALAHVHGYQRKFQQGRFAEEADALEIQALAALGRQSEARTKGERFLASRPGSPYEQRVRSAIALLR